jgi:hypothetical protein
MASSSTFFVCVLLKRTTPWNRIRTDLNIKACHAFLGVLEEWREDKRRTSRVVWRFSKSAHASSKVSTASFGNEEYAGVEKTEDRHGTSALSFSRSAQLSYALSRYVLGLENRSVDKEFDSEKEVALIRSRTAEPCLSGHKFSQSHS